jgi:hypothetical protein
MGERALELMCTRALARTSFGKPLAEQGVVQDWIAESRVRIEQARLLVLKAAWLMDTVGNKGAHTEIQAIKIIVPTTVEWIVDKADPDPRRGRRQPGHPAGDAVGGGAHPAPGRRTRRGTQTLPGPAGAEPAPECHVTPPESPSPARIDGRTARSERTRNAIVDAHLQLIREGDLRPTADRIAKQAGVSLRALWSHFADMEALFAESGQRVLSCATRRTARSR